MLRVSVGTFPRRRSWVGESRSRGDRQDRDDVRVPGINAQVRRRMSSQRLPRPCQAQVVSQARWTPSQARVRRRAWCWPVCATRGLRRRAVDGRGVKRRRSCGRRPTVARRFAQEVIGVARRSAGAKRRCAPLQTGAALAVCCPTRDGVRVHGAARCPPARRVTSPYLCTGAPAAIGATATL